MSHVWEAGLPLEAVRALAELATGGLRPDLIVLLDLPVSEGLSRVKRRGAHDRLEAEEQAFHERVREGYLSLRTAEPERWLPLDATLDVGVLSGRLWDALQERDLVGAGES